ncbi:sugar phosphate isomerase/epimerase family protein [Candidatus Methylobacter oryzae]|uniref:Sugar phosphate isomerase/epimerase n=1 Tax=Candidatus Methylobacter oryzae TaxID=2497749 RepID=A0ABY3C741_9GAMM|nr:sugar phosphate isomerase/epimerase family protein [Candidatus Methylobacter oryzae]TRW91471.1 sugar phosphate isomerase/epimerase [Candidatus Methylobacter oryzae]
MRLAISNIAWDVAEDEAIAALLHRFAVDAIDVAPGKYFPEPADATDRDIARVRNWWAERGIRITGMQALLFGTSGLNIFGPEEVQQAMLQHLNAVCRIGGGLGAKRLVFGSPKNRDRSGLSDGETIDKAVYFFRCLGDIAQQHDVVICLEPNPSCYGANFMTTSAETAMVVNRIAHPAVGMQFDTGALTINGEDPAIVLGDHAPLIGHIHASEPDLLPLGDGATDHRKVMAALTRYLPDRVVSIEMRATRNEPHEVSIERALAAAVRHYRKQGVEDAA